ncbi:hypothetical protein BH09VER1_BH09VER1_33400 [soil metagenome]
MSTNHLPPAEEHVLEPGFDAELFWAKNQKIIVAGAIALVVVVIGVVAWIINDHNSREASEQQLAEAKDVAGWQTLIANYPHSMSAADAYFLMAEALRTQGKVDESTKAYRDFLQAFPKHPLAPGASVGLAENLDLRGKTDEALAALRAVQTGDDSSSYAAPYAAFLEGRILMREGKMADAHRVLSTAYNLFPKSPAAQAAGMQDRDITSVLLSEGKPATSLAP